MEAATVVGVYRLFVVLKQGWRCVYPVGSGTSVNRTGAIEAEAHPPSHLAFPLRVSAATTLHLSAAKVPSRHVIYLDNAT